MAQLLQHQESAFYGKELQGCRWGILQFFGFRRRLRSTKMLSDKKHGHEKGSGGSRRRSSYAPLKNEDSGIIMDEEKNDEVTKKQKPSRKNSGKSSLRSLIRRKLYGKEGQKEKMLPVAPKLLRTISIHYLESNEYVLDSEAASTVDGSSHGSTLSMQDATNKDLQHATSDRMDGSDTISLLSIKRDTSHHVKRKSHRSISMDGVLHKVPYGKKVSDDVISEVLPRSASATYDRDGQKPYIGTAATAKRHVNPGFRRSRSLSESLESYSHLLESIANSDSKRMLTSSKSTRDRSLDGPNVMSALPRTANNAEFRSQSLTRHDELPENALESDDNDAEKTNVHGDKEVEVDERPITAGSENFPLPEECISDRKRDVAVSTEAHSCTDSSPSEVVDISEANAATHDYSATEVDLSDTYSTREEVATLDQDASIRDGDEIQSSMQAADSRILSSGDVAVTAAEEHASRPGDDQMHSFQSSKLMKGTSCVPDPRQDFEADLSLSYEQETESPMSVLDAAFADDPASPEEYTALDDIFLKQNILHLNDPDSSTGIGVDSEDIIIGLQVDATHEAEFNYVKDIFNKSSFRNETLYDEWCSQNLTALQEEDCQHYEAAAAAFDFTDDMSAEQLLLFDLTNEALLDIYRKHSVSKSKLSRFATFDRPKPVGRLVLKELWAEVSRQLDEQPRSATEVDAVLARDMARSDDRWVRFQRDADSLVNDLGEFVVDRLLSQLVLELAADQ